MTIVGIAGPIAAGKSELAKTLAEHVSARHFRSILRARSKVGERACMFHPRDPAVSRISQ